MAPQPWESRDQTGNVLPVCAPLLRAKEGCVGESVSSVRMKELSGTRAEEGKKGRQSKGTEGRRPRSQPSTHEGLRSLGSLPY